MIEAQRKSPVTLEIFGAWYMLELPRHTGSALDWLCSQHGTLWAVIDNRHKIWAIRPTRLGAQRVAGRHRRRYHTATNHYAEAATTVPVEAATLRDLALAEARRTLREAVEVECAGLWNGGLGSNGARAALRALRRAGRYANWHGLRQG